MQKITIFALLAFASGVQNLRRILKFTSREITYTCLVIPSFGVIGF